MSFWNCFIFSFNPDKSKDFSFFDIPGLVLLVPNCTITDSSLKSALKTEEELLFWMSLSLIGRPEAPAVLIRLASHERRIAVASRMVDLPAPFIPAKTFSRSESLIVSELTLRKFCNWIDCMNTYSSLALRPGIFSAHCRNCGSWFSCCRRGQMLIWRVASGERARVRSRRFPWSLRFLLEYWFYLLGGSGAGIPAYRICAHPIIWVIPVLSRYTTKLSSSIGLHEWGFRFNW